MEMGNQVAMAQQQRSVFEQQLSTLLFREGNDIFSNRTILFKFCFFFVFSLPLSLLSFLRSDEDSSLPPLGVEDGPLESNYIPPLKRRCIYIYVIYIINYVLYYFTFRRVTNTSIPAQSSPPPPPRHQHQHPPPPSSLFGPLSK